MKKELFSLVVFLNITLTSGCAFAMGRSRCDNIDIPVRPAIELCISNGNGGAGCYDSRTTPHEFPRQTILNYVCTNAQDYNSNEEWIKNVLDACRGH